MTLGEKIKAARTAAGLTQAQLAEQLRVSRPAVTKWEGDKGIPDIDNLKLIAHYLGVSLDDLLSDEALTDAQPPLGMSDTEKSKPEKPMVGHAKWTVLGRIACVSLLIDGLMTWLAYWLVKDAAAVVLPLLLTFVPLFLYRLWMPESWNRIRFAGGSIACVALTLAVNSALYGGYTWRAYGKAGVHLILWKELLCVTGGMLLLELAMMLPFLLGKHGKPAFSLMLRYAIAVALTLLCAAFLYIPIGNEALPAEVALLLGAVALVAGICRMIFVSIRNTGTDA